MKLYLVQHGRAFSKEQNPQRPLTDKGKSDVEKVASFVKPLSIRVEVIRHSGKTRAAETAEILAEAIIAKTGIRKRDGLNPNDDVTAIADEIISKENDLMIVGHLPFLSKLASLMITGNENAEMIAFMNGGVVCLEKPDDSWQISWVVTPQIIQ